MKKTFLVLLTVTIDYPDAEAGETQEQHQETAERLVGGIVKGDYHEGVAFDHVNELHGIRAVEVDFP